MDTRFHNIAHNWFFDLPTRVPVGGDDAVPGAPAGGRARMPCAPLSS